MAVKLLAEQNLESLSLTGSSETILVKMRHCWKSHVAAHMEDDEGSNQNLYVLPWC